MLNIKKSSYINHNMHSLRMTRIMTHVKTVYDDDTEIVYGRTIYIAIIISSQWTNINHGNRILILFPG